MDRPCKDVTIVFLRLSVVVPQGEKDWEKYEVARRLKSCVNGIRQQYQQDIKSKQMETRQRAVALYFIDKVCLSVTLLCHTQVDGY